MSYYTFHAPTPNIKISLQGAVDCHHVPRTVDDHMGVQNPQTKITEIFTEIPKDMGPPIMVSGTHTIPTRIPKDMGMVWEAYHTRVPLLGVPGTSLEKTTNSGRF